MTDQIKDLLANIYGEEAGEETYRQLRILADSWRPNLPYPAPRPLSNRDSVLITYGDMVREPGSSPLASLHNFLTEFAADIVDTVHLLPFYPHTSDDGFAIVDYRQVDPAIGSWSDVGQLGETFRLMFDAVVNHTSAASEWFLDFLEDNQRHQGYYIAVNDSADLDAVFRPRTSPLLTSFDTAAGPRSVWTTFGPDQVDLNFANPAVLLEIIDLLLFYVSRGAELIRLDAIAYIWKEANTDCLHRPQTHAIVQLFRAVLDEVAPQVALITETNVPHEDNISYFGNGFNEAQMVYNFPLPPLTLHAFCTGNAEILSTWAATLAAPSSRTTFFNFLASHDGIGITPARGILGEEAIDILASRIDALGGHISNRQQSDGTAVPYEFNINFLDALGNPEQPEESDQLIARRFLSSQAVMLALRGVPGIYFHSLFGSRGWPEGVQQTGRPRTVNRRKLWRKHLEYELSQEGSLPQLVFSGYQRLLRARGRSQTAFDPRGGQTILNLAPQLFALKRVSPDGRSAVTCLQNVSSRQCDVHLAARQIPQGNPQDLITGNVYPSSPHGLTVTLEPYQVLWLAGGV